MVFECRVDGKPLPKVKWFLNDKPIKFNNKRLEYTDKKGIVRLNLIDVQQEDAGEYKLTVENESGSASSTCKLVVKDKGSTIIILS